MAAHNIERLSPELHNVYMGEAEVWASEGNRIYKPYLVVRFKSNGTWACGCAAVYECYHIRDAVRMRGER